MVEISAAQLIYARVEAEYSSRGRPGYQTVYQSPSLSAAEVELIERRVQCFRPARPADARLQCFQLPGGRAVIGRSVLVRGDPAIVDRLGRPGAFLCHCLVLSAPEFARAGNNAFALFDAFPFLDDPAVMASDYLRAEPVAEPALIAVEGAPAPATGWPEDEALLLAEAGLRAAADLRARRGLALVGSAEAIEQALRTLIARLPLARRPACSFDSCTDGCPVEPGVFWAVGSAGRPADEARALVQADARRWPR